jgi:hypothetical protein
VNDYPCLLLVSRKANCNATAFETKDVPNMRLKGDP